jgi:hypothetical protein
MTVRARMNKSRLLYYLLLFFGFFWFLEPSSAFTYIGHPVVVPVSTGRSFNNKGILLTTIAPTQVPVKKHFGQSSKLEKGRNKERNNNHRRGRLLREKRYFLGSRFSLLLVCVCVCVCVCVLCVWVWVLICFFFLFPLCWFLLLPTPRCYRSQNLQTATKTCHSHSQCQPISV